MRKKFDEAFKAKVALEAVKEELTLQELAGQAPLFHLHQRHPILRAGQEVLGEIQGFLLVGIPLDGCPEIHDENRVFPDGSSSMQSIICH